MNWFKELTWFDEGTYKETKKMFSVSGLNITANGEYELEYQCGYFRAASLEELRFPDYSRFKSKIKVSEIVADVQFLHTLRENEHATFQVASQFNALEMVSPEVSPMDGVTRYQWDMTQGPACAIACGAGTIFRNYFLPVGDQQGQTDKVQLNLLDDLEKEIPKLWKMKNGYLLTDKKKLEAINEIIMSRYDELIGLVKVGVHSDTQVTLDWGKHVVTQVFCSALPIAYNDIPMDDWEPFARFILEANYEATILAAMENLCNNQNNKVYLTMLGGGAFGNKMEWIVESIEKVLKKYENLPLDVMIVSYNRHNDKLKGLIQRFK